jgi:hypothetical protein
MPFEVRMSHYPPIEKSTGRANLVRSFGWPNGTCAWNTTSSFGARDEPKLHTGKSTREKYIAEAYKARGGSRN